MNKNPRRVQPFDVAFDKDGNLLERYHDKPTNNSYKTSNQYYYQYIKDFTWEANKIFTDTLEYLRGYSVKGSAHFIFKSVNSGRCYSMFLSDFDELLKAKKMEKGYVTGEFTFCKRGCSQGIRLILENVP